MSKSIGFYLSVFQENLSLIDKVLLNYLLNACKRKYWGIEETAKKLGESEKTISRSLVSLESKGYINREKPEGKRYYLTKLTKKALNLIGCTDCDFAEIEEININQYTRGETLRDFTERILNHDNN